MCHLGSMLALGNLETVKKKKKKGGGWKHQRWAVMKAGQCDLWPLFLLVAPFELLKAIWLCEVRRQLRPPHHHHHPPPPPPLAPLWEMEVPVLNSL